MRTLQLRGTQVHFTDACPVCLGPAREEFRFERTFTYGRRSIVLSLPVLLCHKHYRAATARTAAQRWCERLAPVAGAALGLATGAALLWYWQVFALFNVTIALLGAISIGLTLWAIVLFWVTPLFASPETKAVLRSMRLTRYDPFRDVLDLTFTNDTAAELTARANLAILLPAKENLRPYQIHGHILDHDIRYNNRIKTQVLLDHPPTEQEALDLLQPVVDKVMVQQLGVGTFYDLTIIAIEEINAW
jgi:hypothetical protein